MTTLRKITAGIVSFLLPFFLLMTAIRVVFQPVFLQVEYNAPGFPPDPYGFTLEDRLKWGKISLDYLFNDAGISFLADQRLPDGTPLYNERELGHMLDVKNLVQLMLKVWLGLFVALALGLIWAWRGDWVPEFGRAFARGGWLTLGIIGAILIAIVVSFDWLFTAFHRIFFTGDTWLFLYSDSLIRLFPLRLWQDGFIAMGIVTALLAIIFILGGNLLARKRA